MIDKKHFEKNIEKILIYFHKKYNVNPKKVIELLQDKQLQLPETPNEFKELHKFFEEAKTESLSGGYNLKNIATVGAVASVAAYTGYEYGKNNAQTTDVINNYNYTYLPETNQYDVANNVINWVGFGGKAYAAYNVGSQFAKAGYDYFKTPEGKETLNQVHEAATIVAKDVHEGVKATGNLIYRGAESTGEVAYNVANEGIQFGKNVNTFFPIIVGIVGLSVVGGIIAAIRK